MVFKKFVTFVNVFSSIKAYLHRQWLPWKHLWMCNTDRHHFVSFSPRWPWHVGAGRNVCDFKVHLHQKLCKYTWSKSHRYLITTSVETNEQYLNIDVNFKHQIPVSKSKFWHSYICLHFSMCSVPLSYICIGNAYCKSFCES